MRLFNKNFSNQEIPVPSGAFIQVSAEGYAEVANAADAQYLVNAGWSTELNPSLPAPTQPAPPPVQVVAGAPQNRTQPTVTKEPAKPSRSAHR